MVAAVVVGAAAHGEPGAVLSLEAGAIPGSVVGSAGGADGTPPTILWRSPLFDGPFEIPVDGLQGISFPLGGEANSPEAAGRWRIELSDGDSFVGRPESIDDRSILLSIGPAVAPIRLALRRDAVRRLVAPGVGSSFAWNGTVEQLQSPRRSEWLKQKGGVSSDAPGASLACDEGRESRLRYDLTLSWKTPPVVAIGFGGAQAAPANPAGRQITPPGFRLDIGPEGLVVVRDAAIRSGRGRADLALGGPLPEGGVTLSVFIDRRAGRIAVIRPGVGEPIADLTIEPAEATLQLGSAVPVTPPGELAGGPPTAPAGSAEEAFEMRLELIEGAVTLEKLRIVPWQGDAWPTGDERAGEVMLADGGAIPGAVVGMAAGSAELIVRTADGGSRSIALAEVSAIRFPSRGDIAAADPPALVGPLRIGDRFGSSFTASLARIAEGTASFSHPAVEGVIVVPIEILRSIDATAAPSTGQALPGPIGRLAIDDSVHEGCLVPIDGEDGPTGQAWIGWQPRGSLTAAPFLRQGEAGVSQLSITFPEVMAKRPNASLGWVGARIVKFGDGQFHVTSAVDDGPLEKARLRGFVPMEAIAPRGDGRFVSVEGLSEEDVLRLLDGRSGTALQLRVIGFRGKQTLRVVRVEHPERGRDLRRLREVLQAHERLLDDAADGVDHTAPDWFGSVVVLVTGESIPCRVESIDEGGVVVRREHDGPVTIPSAMVKAVELEPTPGAMISPEKFRSLTTLPRAQALAPPTHLVRSARGDYLRGRLVEMDGDTIRIALESDSRGKPQQIRRRDATRLIWLHPQASMPEPAPPATEMAPGLPVEAISAGTMRMRFSASGIEGTKLIGRHEVLGTVRIDLENIERLLIGGGLFETPLLPPFSQWQLRPASEPRNLPRNRPAAN